MATSDSDDFESADEELVAADDMTSRKSGNRGQWQKKPASSSTIGSDSDDDNECMPVDTKNCSATRRNSGNCSVQCSGEERRRSRTTEPTASTDFHGEREKETGETEARDTARTNKTVASQTKTKTRVAANECLTLKEELDGEATKSAPVPSEIADKTSDGEKQRRQKKAKEATGLGAKRLGIRSVVVAKPPPSPPVEASRPEELCRKGVVQGGGETSPAMEEHWEFDERETAKILKGLSDAERVKMPEELRSEKKFKEVFKTDGWEGLDDETILSQLEEDESDAVLTKIAEPESSTWGGWGSWGVGSLINSASAGVSTLTSRVTHGLTLLDEAMGAPAPRDLADDRAAEIVASNADDDGNEEDDADKEVRQAQVSFGFNDLLSGVSSSITKLVETTGSKVISGGLETLETIGKKTMQVLQEGDPGLKKKRAFFLNESDKPILSQMLREAKEKAEAEEKSFEEKELSRKVHFESLFDDFQGLVHLEALEMLSKRCNMKIQQRLVVLDAEELNSVRETLEEVKELCDLGDENEDDEDRADESQENLEERLEAACKDLGVSITYEKLNDIWRDTRTYVLEISSARESARIDERQVFQRAISTLARFTAFSVERFHKTGELLLIKERRSTVNEADALVQLTRILSRQIGIAANIFSNWLNERAKETQPPPDDGTDITTIFLEAANASSYIQDAFRLLIPILQVGAI